MSRPAIPESVCILGAGPIRIGQACEFDYSGVQGVKALREEGCRVVLVNSNPATVMTDARLAHRSYVEPLILSSVTAVLERERPNALIPTLGGQTALNLAVELEETGVLERLGIQLLGASVRSIRLAEDREEFRQAMTEAGLPVLPATTVTSVEEGIRALETIGLPVILRPSFTLGGWGGGTAHDRPSFEELLRHGLEASPTNQVLVETSVLGWKEFELEVMRDSAGAFVVVCSIENFDPMGVHTGDSITVAPAQTLTDREYQVLRDAARGVLDAVGVATGGANVQFAVNPADGRYAIIEMNPRVSRSSALASKATGFPIARIAAKVALGRRLDEISNDITGTTPASFEPALDYVVVKIPRFAFEKFPGAEPVLGTAMKAVGEVAAMGRSFEEALLKAIRSLEIDRDSLDAPPDLAAADDDGLAARLAIASPERLWELAEVGPWNVSWRSPPSIRGFCDGLRDWWRPRPCSGNPGSISRPAPPPNDSVSPTVSWRGCSRPVPRPNGSGDSISSCAGSAEGSTPAPPSSRPGRRISTAASAIATNSRRRAARS